ncbi:MAG: general secretion pathway protein GspB [Gammaproteobacteria bacterium]|nr:general secretion pathway protein GspB [Gammaproteobacteria bacterium]
MSFILDAIAKSEQERQQQEVPQAQVLALPLDNTPAKRRLLPYFIAAALLLNIIFLAIWIQSSQPDRENIPALEKVEPIEAPTAQLVAPEPVTQVVEQEVAEPEILVSPPKPIPAPATQESKPLLSDISSLSELPGNIRKDLPTIVFSGHLYSSNPAASFVYVDNNRPVRKGQRIVGDVYLHEITPTGVVVEFRDYLIDVGVLQNWTLN